MAIIEDNKMLTQGAKRTAQSIRFAFLSSMYPTVHEKYGKRFVCFSNGKEVIFVSNNDLNELAFCANLNNACKANDVKADLSRYAKGLDSDAQVCKKVYEAINECYTSKAPTTPDDAMQMFLSAEERKQRAREVTGDSAVINTPEERLAYVERMVREFPAIARSADINLATVNAAMDALLQDVRYIKQYRDRVAMGQFADVEKE